MRVSDAAVAGAVAVRTIGTVTSRLHDCGGKTDTDAGGTLQTATSELEEHT
jgi:hypothetical protein